MVPGRKRDIVVIAASAGGIEALRRRILRGLPPGLGAALFVVQHVGARPSVLPEILAGAGPLPAAPARDGEPIEHGRIYVAPPDQHMILDRDRVRLERGAKEHHTRPAADPLFRSAAASHGPRVVAIVLSGGDSDGADGMHAVTEHGGVGIVQAPEEAKVPDMPNRAIEGDYPSYRLPADAIAPLLIELINGTGERGRRAPQPGATPSRGGQA
jgi:two-component system chemotaxis response regulator CheB